MDDTSQALQRIARGAGIVFAGTIISMFFGFLSRALIARFFSRAEYGVFSLALIILLSRLGFDFSIIRFFPNGDKSEIFSAQES